MKRHPEPGRRWRTVFLVLALLEAVRPAAAHPLAPSLLDLRETEAGRTTVLWRRPLLLPIGAHPEPVLPARCRIVEPPVETAEGPAVVRRWTVDCGAGGWSGERVEVRQLASAGSDVLLRVALANGRTYRTVLGAEAPSAVLPADPQGWAEEASGFLRLGVEHLLTGWDHLAFVSGLVLLVAGRRKLLGTITAFTLGHSLTLSIAALGLVRLPPTPIEALIAASILVLAMELSRERPTLLGRRPWLMAASFGLLHGLGFAGALAQVGLPAGEIPLALVSFNVGIELGQLVFVAGLLALGSTLGRVRPRLPVWISTLPTYGIGVLAAFWLFERLSRL